MPVISDQSEYHLKIKRQLASLGNSQLWRYLPSILNGDISEYLKLLCLSPSSDSDTSFPINHLAEFLAFFQTTIPAYIHKSAFSCGPINTQDFFIEAKFILTTVQKCNGLNQSSTSLESFLSFPIEHAVIQESVFVAYQKMENKLLAMIMLLHMHKEMSSETPSIKNFFMIVCHPIIYRWLRGQDLVLLDDIYYKKFIGTMINESIKLHRSNPNDRGKDPTLLRIIDSLLSRMEPERLARLSIIRNTRWARARAHPYPSKSKSYD